MRDAAQKKMKPGSVGRTNITCWYCEAKGHSAHKSQGSLSTLLGMVADYEAGTVALSERTLEKLNEAKEACFLC